MPVPEDDPGELRAAFYLFTAIGIGYLFPFSALTQPVDYWSILFPDFNIEFPLTAVYMWVNLVVLFALVFVGGQPVYKRRIYGGFLGQLAALLIVPSSWFFHFSEKVNFVIVMGSTLLAAVVTAFIDSCAISFSAQYPTEVQSGLQLGIGLSTFIGSVYRIFTKLVFPNTMTIASSLIYFYCGAITIIVCIYAYHKLRTLPISQKYVIYGLSSASFVERRSEASSELAPLVDLDEGETSGGGDSYQSFGRMVSRSHHAVMSRKDSTEDSYDNTQSEISAKMKVLFKALPNLCVVLCIFVTTLLLWPAVVTEISSFNFPYLQETRWWSLILLFLFSFSDCVGRMKIGQRWIITAANVWLFALLRFLICTLLIVCSARGLWFTHDLWSILFVVALGYTNGYLGSLAILLVNDCVSEAEMGLAGSFTGLFLNAGLVIGATASLFVHDIIDALVT